MDEKIDGDEVEAQFWSAEFRRSIRVKELLQPRAPEDLNLSHFQRTRQYFENSSAPAEQLRREKSVIIDFIRVFVESNNWRLAQKDDIVYLEVSCVVHACLIELKRMYFDGVCFRHTHSLMFGRTPKPRTRSGTRPPSVCDTFTLHPRPFS